MRKKTHEEYVAELAIKNPNLEVIGTYINANTPILHRCLLHNVLWETTPSRALCGIGCEMCRIGKYRQSRIKSHKQYVEDVKLINPDIEVVEKYVDATTAINHFCKRHSVLWKSTPDNILHGHGCWECGKEKIADKNSTNHNEYIIKLSSVNPNLIVLEGYINTETKIKHKCIVCGYEWKVKPGNILAGKGCPKCNELHGEKNVSTYLTKNDIAYIPQYTFDDCKDKRKLPFDFYLPELNACIEYDGEQHFKAVEYFGGDDGLKIRQLHDEIKTNYCNNNNIWLLRIRYDENIEEKLKNFIHLI